MIPFEIRQEILEAIENYEEDDFILPVGLVLDIEVIIEKYFAVKEPYGQR